MSRKEHIMRLSHAVRRWHRLSIMGTLLKVTGALVALQAIVLIVIEIVSARRKRQRQEGSFPHPRMNRCRS